MKSSAQYRTQFCPIFSKLCLPVLFISLGWTSCITPRENRPSPFRSDSVSIQNIDLKIEYSSPRVRGRKIFGLGDDYLLQYGEVWRTGANEATTLSISGDIKIGPHLLPKGKYAFFTIPRPKSWEIIINKDWDQWGSSYRKESQDVLNFKVPVQTILDLKEDMTFFFQNDSLSFLWEHVKWSVSLTGSNHLID